MRISTQGCYIAMEKLSFGATMRPFPWSGRPAHSDQPTAGTSTRFEEADILNLMEITNTVRQRVWRQQPRGFLTEAFIDTDGTVAPTVGECKGGMALSYKGIWGYAPLVVTLAKTNEVL